MNIAKVHSAPSFSSSSQQLIHASEQFGIRFYATSDSLILDPQDPEFKLDIIANHYYYMSGTIVFVRGSETFEVFCDYDPAPVKYLQLDKTKKITKISLPQQNDDLRSGSALTTELRIKEGVFATLQVADSRFGSQGWVPFTDEHGQNATGYGDSPVLVDGNVKMRFSPSNSGGVKTVVWARYAK